MKKFCISLLLVAAGMHAAESSTSATELVEWDAQASHVGDGVHIVLGIKSSMDYTLRKQFVGMFSHCLALKLGSDMSFKSASQHVKETLKTCEKKVKETKVEAFFESLKQSLDGEKVVSIKKQAIQRMLLLVGLAQSGVKIKVEGSAESITCQTFFPPYTLVSEGNAELTPAERELAVQQEKLAQASKSLFAFQQQSISELMGAFNDDLEFGAN